MLISAAIVAATLIHGGCEHIPRVRSPRLQALITRAWEEYDAAQDPAQQPAQAVPATPLDKRHQDDLARDTEMGRKYSEEVAKIEKFSENQEFIARVERIGGELSEIARTTPVEVTWGDKRLNPFNYTFKVVQGKDVNAFSLPGGFIFIYEGLIQYTESEHELAGVIAHEIAHAAFRHVATLQREQSRLSSITLPLILIGIMAGASEAGFGAFQLGNLIGQAKGSGWSLQAEDSADYGGFQYMRKSKYNPVGILTFMERLAKDERGRPNVDWGIYQTHPLSRERAANLYSYLVRDEIPVRRSQVTTTFRTEVKPGAEEGKVDLWFAGRRLVTFAGSTALARADEASAELNRFFDETPELFNVTATDDQILYRRNPVLRLTLEDAEAARTSLPALADQTLRNIKASLFTLGFRIWGLRG